MPMSAAVLPPPQHHLVLKPRPFRWNCEEFHQLGDEGRFDGSKVILVDGEILDTPLPNPPHDMSTSLTDYKLKAIFSSGYVVRVQSCLVLGQGTDPGPDLAVVVGSPRDYSQHPRTAVLVVEVSESSLNYDRGEKANLYAAGGILDYWAVDLVNRQLLVFRDPQPDPAEPHGHVYHQQLAFGPADAVAPLAAPQANVVVSELLP
jgi:Uma2 family endonuclease